MFYKMAGAVSSSVVVDEYSRQLIGARTSFRYKALEHSNAISLIQGKKRYELLDAVTVLQILQTSIFKKYFEQLLSYMHAESTFFHQGSDLFEDIDPFLKKVSMDVSRLNTVIYKVIMVYMFLVKVSQLRHETIDLEKDLRNQYSVVTSNDLVPPSKSETWSGIRMESYLYKRTNRPFKSWNRRWFAISSGQLFYRKRTGFLDFIFNFVFR